jgi:hypothetical protein
MNEVFVYLNCQLKRQNVLCYLFPLFLSWVDLILYFLAYKKVTITQLILMNGPSHFSVFFYDNVYLSQKSHEDAHNLRIHHTELEEWDYFYQG